MKLCPARLNQSTIHAAARIFLAASALTASPVYAENLQIRYSVKLLGLPMGSATLNGTVEPAGYRLEAGAKLTGVATIVSNAKGAATSTGQFVQGRVASNGFATTSSNSQQTRTIRIGMQAGNVRAAEISPPFDSPPDRIPVTEAQKRNVLDPLSAMLMPMAISGASIGPTACNRNLPVFDGWTRFDIALAYAGNREAKIKGYQGPVAVCSVRYTPISGHRDRPVVKFMTDNRDMEVTLAPVGDSGTAVPTRIAVKTLIGMLTIEATEFVVSGSSKAALR